VLAGAPINCQNANLIVDHTAVCKKLNYYYLNNVENFGYRRVKVLVQRIVSGEETAVGGGVLCAERERESNWGFYNDEQSPGFCRSRHTSTSLDTLCIKFVLRRNLQFSGG
jgi:hypothetical protein